MRILRVRVTSDFTKSLRKLPKYVQKAAEKKDRLFRQDPFHPSLKTHPLHGELKNYYSYSVNYYYRTLFKFLDSQTVVYYDVGTHGIYKAG